MRYLFLLALATALLLSGCIQPTPPANTCPANYMKVGTDCCLDANANGICDRDEQTPPVCPPQNKNVCTYPYIQVGADCCLDQNSNNICDKDEQQTAPTCPACPPQTKTVEDRIKDCKEGGTANACLNRLALELNNPGICSELGSYPNPDNCLKQLAIKYQNRAYCNLMDSLSMVRMDCLDTVGLPPSSGNMSVTDRMNQCNQLSTSPKQEDCLKALALETNTPSICASFLYGEYRDWTCYEQLAIKYKNKGYCDQLSGWDKDSCIQKVTDASN